MHIYVYNTGYPHVYEFRSWLRLKEKWRLAKTDYNKGDGFTFLPIVARSRVMAVPKASVLGRSD